MYMQTHFSSLISIKSLHIVIYFPCMVKNISLDFIVDHYHK